MELNNYSLYTRNAKNTSIDKVDEFIIQLELLDSYKEVVDYININFGVIEDKKVIEYPELNKQVEIVFKDNAVEFFAAKEWKQYYGKGWFKVIKAQKSE